MKRKKKRWLLAECRRVATGKGAGGLAAGQEEDEWVAAGLSVCRCWPLGR